MGFDITLVSQGWLFTNGHLLLRDSRSLEELAERLAGQPRIGGVNVVAADRRSAAAFEVTPDRVYRQNALDGILVRTNHYVTPEIRHLTRTREEYPSTHHRYQVAMSQLYAQHGEWDHHRLAGLLASHDGYPQLSLCRHSQGGEGADTIYASIAQLPEGVLWTTLDNPCKTETSVAHPAQ